MKKFDGYGKAIAAAITIIVVTIRYFIPDIDEAALYSVVGTIVTYILGVSAVEYAEKRDK
jgi:xanthine/uracil/vitamin C permease (AzgA family)